MKLLFAEMAKTKEEQVWGEKINTRNTFKAKLNLKGISELENLIY